MTGFRLERGAQVRSEGGVRFCVWAPFAERVSVCVAAAGRDARFPLEREADGVFAGVIPAARAGADYRYRLDDRAERPDPVSRHQPEGVHGPSRVVDPGAFRWTDTGWSGIALEELVTYELHVGAFTAAGTFEAAIEPLAGLRELGVTAIELMPVAQFPGRRNWGYDGVFPYAPQHSYGGPEGLRRLVDAAHGLGLAVLLDVVYNHLGPEGNVLGDFGPYFTDHYRTPWGDALNFDRADSDEVRRYFVDNACTWISEFHIDGLRLDAVHAICDMSARHLLEEIAAAAHELGSALGRTVHVIAESDLNDPRLVRPAAHGGYALDAVWSDDFHHAVHAALTGERNGYYVDFGGIEPVARAYRDRFVLDGEYSRFRRRRHGALAGDVPRSRFVVCVQNHDQVGNRARGERLTSLVAPARLRLAAALCLLSPYPPLLFMGEEYAETNPFLYFVDHRDPKLLEAVREGRRAEFAAFAWEGTIPDPAAPETFESSRLQWELADEPGHREHRHLVRELLRLRRSEPALIPGRAEIDVACDEKVGWMRVRYVPASGRTAVALFQLGAEPASVPGPGAGSFRVALATDQKEFGGSGSAAPARWDGGAALRVPPDAAWLYLEEGA